MCPECGADLMPSVRSIKVHVHEIPTEPAVQAVQCVDCGRLFADEDEVARLSASFPAVVAISGMRS